MKIRSLSLQKICIFIGACLFIGGVVMLGVWRWNVNASVKQAQYYVNTLRDLIPEPQNAIPEERRDNTMSVISIDQTDFVGIIEIPRYGSELPVCADWGRDFKYPCRFGGSIYDGTMQIGATTQKGQYDFYRDLSVGDTVIYTDVEGNQYTFVITSLRYEEHADQSVLQQEDAPLTLFLKNIYSFEYLIIFCDVLY
jgi:sortase (surface protein transpeptidase)